jgi:hypothetical protein
LSKGLKRLLLNLSVDAYVLSAVTGIECLNIGANSNHLSFDGHAKIGPTFFLPHLRSKASKGAVVMY